MDILSLCQRMVMLFFCMACGFCAAKGGAMDVQSNKKLSSLIVTVANPMQILASALTGERLLSIGQTLRLMGLIALLYAALIGLSFPIARLLRVKEREAGLYRFMFIFGNIGFLGYPVVESLLGYQATFYVTLAVLAFQLLCWSYGVSLIEGQARFHFQWKILRQPRCSVAGGVRDLSVRLAATGAAAPDCQICRRHHKSYRHADCRLFACADAIRANLRKLAGVCAGAVQDDCRAVAGAFCAAAGTGQ